MRAALTILGVAIGVTVVMVIGALISGFNKGITDMLASRTETFWVGAMGGQGDEDPEDPNPWRRRPPITVEGGKPAVAAPHDCVRGRWTRAHRRRRVRGPPHCRGPDPWPECRLAQDRGRDINVGRSFTHLETRPTAMWWW